MHRNFRYFLVVFLALALSAALHAQTLGEIVGEVKDPAGAIVTGATVSVTNSGTNATRSMPTNQSGMYSFPGLVPGNYTVKVEMAGFRPAAHTLDLQVQQTALVDFSLEVGQLDQSVEVTAAAALLNTEDATVGTVIEQQRITNLPLNGRNYLQLVALSPNVSYGFAAGNETGTRMGGDRAGQNMSINGARAVWNNYTLDGVTNTDPNFNTYIMMPSVDMLQEFKVQSGIYPAEFGREATQINVSTRPGSNQYHSSLYEFVRNDKFDARPYDFTAADHLRGKNPFQWNQYGFVLGGPIRIPKVVNGKDKLFFMSNFERFRQVTRPNGVYSVPSVAMRGGDFSELNGLYTLYDPEGRSRAANGQVIATPFPNNIVPATRISYQAQVLLKYEPLPDSPSQQASPKPPYQNFREATRGTSNKDQFHLRTDYVESPKSFWFGRYSWTDEALVNPGMYLNGTSNAAKAHQYMISNTRVFSPKVFNEFRFGIATLNNLQAVQLAYQQDVVAQLKIPGMPDPPGAGWAVPTVEQIVGLDTFGGGGDPYETRDASFQWVDNVSINRGKHAFRFGTEIRRDRYNEAGNQFLNPDFWFNGSMTQNPNTQAGGYGVADLLLGYSTQIRYAPLSVTLQLRATKQNYYFDDTWRVSRNLTITMGLRYEYNPPYTDHLGTLCNFYLPQLLIGQKNVQNLSLHPILVRAGKGNFYDGLPFRYQPNLQVARNGMMGDRLINPDYTNFAPRLGIAWNLSPNWTIRTGAGIFYSAEVANTLFDLGRALGGRVQLNPPTDIPTTTMANFLGNQGSSIFTLPAAPQLWMMDPNVKNSRSYQYLFNVQHEFTNKSVVEFGYLGMLSRHLWGLYDSNEAVPSGDGSSPPTRAPFPEFGIIQTVHSNARGHYNAGSVKFTRRFSSGMTALIGYTFSKSMDMASAWRGQGDSRSAQTVTCYLKCENAPSGYDTPHRVVASVLYDLPFGKGKTLGSNWGAVANHIIGGWQLSSIVTLQSGRRTNMVISSNRNSLAYIDGQRPNATGQALNLPPDQRSLQRWFNTSAVAVPPAGVIGNIGRNVLLGPAMQAWDLSALKSFRIREGHTLTFRAEAFNIANHPIFSRPGANIGANPTGIPASFGAITSTDQPMRQVQLGLKYAF